MGRATPRSRVWGGGGRAFPSESRRLALEWAAPNGIELENANVFQLLHIHKLRLLSCPTVPARLASCPALLPPNLASVWPLLRPLCVLGCVHSLPQPRSPELHCTRAAEGHAPRTRHRTSTSVGTRSSARFGGRPSLAPARRLDRSMDPLASSSRLQSGAGQPAYSSRHTDRHHASTAWHLGTTTKSHAALIGPELGSRCARTRRAPAPRNRIHTALDRLRATVAGRRPIRHSRHDARHIHPP